MLWTTHSLPKPGLGPCTWQPDGIQDGCLVRRVAGIGSRDVNFQALR